MTKGPCCATGSPIGRPCSTSSDADADADAGTLTFASTPASNSTADFAGISRPSNATASPSKKYACLLPSAPIFDGGSVKVPPGWTVMK